MRTSVLAAGTSRQGCERVTRIESQYPRNSRLNQPVMPWSFWT
jgi:hypothetical protein